MRDRITEIEQLTFEHVPPDLSDRLVQVHFTLPPEAREVLKRARGSDNMLGIAAQWGTVSLLGKFLTDFRGFPLRILDYLARQADLPTPRRLEYPQKPHTLYEHQEWIAQALDLKAMTEEDSCALAAALFEEALVSSVLRPLLSFAVKWLGARRILLPGAAVLERLVGNTRERAETEIFERIEVQLPDDFKAKLADLLALEPSRRTSTLEGLKSPPGRPSREAIKREMEKLRTLRVIGADRVRLTDLPAERLRTLSTIARKADVSRIASFSQRKKLAVLACLLTELSAETADAILKMYGRLVRDMRRAARREAEEQHLDSVEERTRKIRLLAEVLRTLSAWAADPPHAVDAVRDLLPQDRWPVVADECETLVAADEGRELDRLTRRYSRLRAFLPDLLELFEFKGYAEGDALLRAIRILRTVNAGEMKGLPLDLPTEFIDDHTIARLDTADEGERRRIYEFAVGEALKDDLERGDLWIDEGRDYAHFAIDLVSEAEWRRRREEVFTRLGLPIAAADFLGDLSGRFRRLAADLARGLRRNHFMRIEGGELRTRRVPAVEVLDEVQQKLQLASGRLPRVMLDQLLVQVDRRVNFTRHFVHLGGDASRIEDLVAHVRACLVAEGTGMGLRRMADCAPALSLDRLVYVDKWYVHEKALELATRDLVSAQGAARLAASWGAGTRSSSDGQRFAMPMDVLIGEYHPRYFAHYGRGVNVITFMDDRFTAFYTTVVPVTEREAVYVLDGLLNHATEIDPEQHYTDTHGFTENLFALSHLLGIRFTPRLADLTRQRLFAPPDMKGALGPLAPLFAGGVNFALIAEQWDEIGRLVASILLGRTIPSRLLAKMGSYSKRNRLFRAVQELGRLVKTCFLLEYLGDEKLRQEIEFHLNMQESQNALRRFLFFGQRGELRVADPVHQRIRMRCLNLLVNCAVIWNTEALQRILTEMQMEGRTLAPEDLRHLTPLGHAHITPFGRYRFGDPEDDSKARGIIEPGIVA